MAENLPDTNVGNIEYINKQVAIDVLDKEYRYGADIDRCGLATALDEIEALPAADVVPVRLGEWLDGYKMQTCSLCKCRGKKSWTFCPHCGARMIHGERKE